MNVLFVDDEELQLIRLETSVKKVMGGDNVYLRYTNPLIAVEATKTNKIDIAFLDIEMPGVSGVELAKKLKAVNPKVNLIFVTAYNEYAVEAYKLHASGYITKTVNEQKIRAELAALRYPVEIKGNKKVQIKCFGNFEVFVGGEPVKFARKKSKELFAYLVDREGAAINVNELNAVLWEDEDHKSYCRNLIADIKNTLRSFGVDDVFVKRRSECFIDVDKVDCDAYEYKKGNPNAVRAYRGEYMTQYPWAIFESDE